MSDLADAHILAQARIRDAAVRGIEIAWTNLPTYDLDQVPVFARAATAAVQGAQRAAINLTNAYLAQAAGRTPLAIDADEILAGIRGPITPEEVYRRPFVTTWAALGRGRPWEQAVAAGMARAKGSAAIDVQLAMTHTLVHVGELDEQIVGYARVPDGGACKFCKLVAGQRYTTARLMPVHNGCGCGVDVITRANRHRFTGKPDNDLDQVAIHQHGELGPILGDPAHTFTGPGDLTGGGGHPTLPPVGDTPQVGRLLPRVEDADIELARLTRYTLNENHPVGGHKAYIMRKDLGLTAADAVFLRDAIAAGIMEFPVAKVSPRPEGRVSCTVVVPVLGPSGLQSPVTTGWSIDAPGLAPRLVTAFINKPIRP